MTSLHRSPAFSFVMALLSFSCAELKSVDDSEQWENPANGPDAGTDGDDDSDGHAEETDGTSGDGSTGDGSGDGTSGDGTSGDGTTGDGSTGDGSDGSTGDGSTGDGSTGDGSTGDGSTGDGSTGDGSAGDGSMGDGSMGDGSGGDGDGDGDPGGICSGVPAYVAGTNYVDGDRVTHVGSLFRCKPYPFEGWCKNAAYEPGVSSVWMDAWDSLGSCNAN